MEEENKVFTLDDLTEKKEGETAEISLCNLYDLNKGIVQSSQVELSEGVLNSKKEIIKNFLRKTDNQYYMLLCNERRDYTIFNLDGEDISSAFLNKEYDCLNDVLIEEILKPRGQIRGIDLTQDHGALEIWLSIQDDSYAYYFFPYDSAIISITKEMELGGK